MNNKSAFLFSIGRLIGNSKLYRSLLMKRFSTEDKLNIGCGSNFVENWINIGLFDFVYVPYFIYLTKKKKNNALVIHFDITKDIPVNSDSIKYIYASHFIEHLSLEQGLKFLKNCFKVMKKSGIIRLTFPDLELFNKKYYENDLDFFKKHYNLTKDFNNLPELKTKGEVFMSQLHGWGHRWGYDFESIKDILERAGFKNVEKKKAFDSLLPDIKKLEPSTEGRLLVSLYVEVIK